MIRKFAAWLLAAVCLFSSAAAAELTLNPSTGTLEGVQPSFLIKNLGSAEQPRYTKIADVMIPEGFRDLGGLKSDHLEQNFFLVPTDESAFADTILILYMPEKRAEDLASVYGQYQDFLSMTEAENISFAGHDVHLRTLLHEEYDYDDMGNKTDLLGFYLSCATYTNVGNGALMVAVFTKTEADATALPTPADLLILLETLYGNIEIDPEFR